MRRPLLTLVALAFVITGTAAAAPSAAPAAAPAGSAATAAPAAAPAGGHVVVMKDGTRIPCTEPPLIALGRVLYRSADGARHAVPADTVNLELTRPTAKQLATPQAPPATANAQHGGLPPQQAPAALSTGRREAPDFTARRADGTDVKLSELRGKVVLVDFWATWCGPCVAEMPNVKKLYEKHAGPQFEIVGVSLDRSRAEMEAFLKAQGMTWPQSFDGKAWENAVAKQYGVYSIPTTLLLDRQGKVAKVGMRGPMLEEAVAEILAEPVPGKPKKS